MATTGKRKCRQMHLDAGAQECPGWAARDWTKRMGAAKALWEWRGAEAPQRSMCGTAAALPQLECLLAAKPLPGTDSTLHFTHSLLPSTPRKFA